MPVVEAVITERDRFSAVHGSRVGIAMRGFPARTYQRRGTDAQLLPSVGGNSAESADLADLACTPTKCSNTVCVSMDQAAASVRNSGPHNELCLWPKNCFYGSVRSERTVWTLRGG